MADLALGAWAAFSLVTALPYRTAIAQEPPPPAASVSETPERATLVVELKGFASDQGLANVTLFNRKEGFPIEPKKAMRQAANLKIRDRKLQVIFEDLPPGAYAVAVYHDENANMKLDANFIGVPTEPLGTSNDVSPRFGPPSFDDAKIDLKPGRLTITITVKK